MYLDRAHPAFLTTLVVLVFKLDNVLVVDNSNTFKDPFGHIL